MGPDQVIVTGPASPYDLADLVDPADHAACRRILGLGGQPVNELVRALAGSGMHVSLVTLSAEVTSPVSFSGEHVQIHVGPYRESGRARARDFFLVERRAVRDLVGQCSGNLVHAHWTYEFALGSASTGKHVIATAHDAPWAVLAQMPDAYRLVRAIMAERSRRVVDRLTVVSPYLAEEWNKWGRRGTVMEVLPNIVRVPTDRAAVAQATGHEGIRFVSVGNDSRLKNVETLARAFASARHCLPDASLSLIGPGLGPESALAARLRQNSAAGGIRFLGKCTRSRVLDEVSQSDVMVHPSREESFGLAVAEALALGVPVIADSRSPAVAWVVGDQRLGQLVDVRRSGAIAEAMVRLGRDADWRKEWIMLRKQSMASRFGPEAVADKCRELYHSMGV